jgi:fumarate reductase subunit D
MFERLTPLLWLLFSGGGVISALFFPVMAFLFAIAYPLGWVAAPDFDRLSALVRHPLTRLFLFVLVALPLFHWAHRFRYTLYDGLQLYHLTNFIAVLCYGAAAIVSLAAMWVLLTL